MSFNIQWNHTSTTEEHYQLYYADYNSETELKDSQLTVDLGEVTSSSDPYPVCKIIFITNKAGRHNLYLGATPFSTRPEGSNSDVYIGYHIALSITYEVEDGTITWNDILKIEDDPTDSCSIYIPIDIDLTDLDEGSGGFESITTVISVSAILSSYDRMIAGQHTSTLTLMRVTE